MSLAIGLKVVLSGHKSVTSILPNNPTQNLKGHLYLQVYYSPVLCYARLGKHNTDEKCYNQLGCNIMANLVVTLRPIAVTTKSIVKTVTIKLVVSAYF